MTQLQIKHIIDTLDSYKVDYVIIGGVAAVTHGSPYSTEDIDITPDSHTDNLSRLTEALKKLNARLYDPENVNGNPIMINTRFLQSQNISSFVTNAGEIDVSMQPAGSHGYAELVKESTNRILDLSAIIRLKETARRDKDLRVLPELKKLERKQKK